MHFAKLEKSPRLQRVLEALQAHGKLTTRELIQTANVCAVNSCIAELKAQGHDITCRQVRRGVFQYTFAGKE